MKTRVLAALLLLPAAGVTAENDPAVLFRAYVRSQAVTMRGGASKADIDRLLAFYTDDVVYEDPAVKVRIEGKDRIRSGMLSHIDDYAGTVGETSISVDTAIAHANAVAAVVAEVFWIKGPTGRQEIRRKRLKVAEFRNNKICRLIDYH